MKTSFDFSKELQKLKNGEVSAIEFGEPNKPMGYFSHLLIRRMNTIGGNQFSIHLINHVRQLHSGMYYGDDADKVEIEALRLAEAYLAPRQYANPKLEAFLKKSREKMPELDFFTV